MPEFTQEIDIDINDFLNECSSWEMRELISELEDRGYIKRNSSTYDKDDNEPNYEVSDWSDILYKIMDNKHQLTSEDELTIQNIFKKLI